MNYRVEELILKLDNVGLSYNGKPILAGVNAEVHNITRPGMAQGQVVCLLGPSGMGKTQLFRMLSGLQAPTTGQVLVGAEQHLVQPGMVGVVSQHYTLFRHRTVLGNLLLAGRQAGKDYKAAKEAALGYLSQFGLVDKRDVYPAQLSGGQRQRVAIIQQMMCSKHFLLMDEPFSGLDPLMKDEVCHTIQNVSRQDELNTIVLTTHDISTAIAVADTIWLLGRQRDQAGVDIGAGIVKTYDLAAMDLAWQPDIRSRKEFAELAWAIRQDFER